MFWGCGAASLHSLDVYDGLEPTSHYYRRYTLGKSTSTLSEDELLSEMSLTELLSRYATLAKQITLIEGCVRAPLSYAWTSHHRIAYIGHLSKFRETFHKIYMEKKRREERGFAAQGASNEPVDIMKNLGVQLRSVQNHNLDCLLEGDYSEGFSLAPQDSWSRSEGLRVTWQKEWSYHSSKFMHVAVFIADGKDLYATIYSYLHNSDREVEELLCIRIVNLLVKAGCTLNGEPA